MKLDLKKGSGNQGLSKSLVGSHIPSPSLRALIRKMLEKHLETPSLQQITVAKPGGIKPILKSMHSGQSELTTKNMAGPIQTP